jgi:hypothetical protein
MTGMALAHRVYLMGAHNHVDKGGLVTHLGAKAPIIYSFLSCPLVCSRDGKGVTYLILQILSLAPNLLQIRVSMGKLGYKYRLTLVLHILRAARQNLMIGLNDVLQLKLLLRL